MKHLAFLILALPLLLAGCQTANQTAYKTIAATEATVDHAMIGWGNYVLWQRQQPGFNAARLAQDEAAVQQGYLHYRNAVNLFYDTRRVVVAPQGEGLQRVTDAAASLVNLINGFLPTERKL